MLTLYDAARCPYCARVRIVLAEKGVEYETFEIDLDDRPDWIYDLNPTGRVPVLVLPPALPESVVIMEYLEEAFPEPPLLSASPADRAFARLWIERFDWRLGDAYYAVRRGESPERLEENLRTLDESLAVRPYLATGYTLADVAYVPWVLRLRDRLGIELARWPHVEAWVDRLLERPAVAAELHVVAAL